MRMTVIEILHLNLIWDIYADETSGFHPLKLNQVFAAANGLTVKNVNDLQTIRKLYC